MESLPHTTSRNRCSEYCRSAGAVAGGSLAYKFECSKSQGGLLVIRDDADKTSVLSSVDVAQYIRQNHDFWHRFAIDPAKYGLDCKPEDIIFVRGTVKTSAWAVAALKDRGHSIHDVSFSGQIGPFADAGFKVSSQNVTESTFEQRSGPSSRAR